MLRVVRKPFNDSLSRSIVVRKPFKDSLSRSIRVVPLLTVERMPSTKPGRT